MVSEDELFGGKKGTHEPEVMINNDSNDLLSKLKNLQDDTMNLYAAIIHDPFKNGHRLDELRRNVVKTAATLLEHGVKIEIPTKERNAEDVLKAAAAELASMGAAKGGAAGLSFVTRVRQNITSGEPEVELVIYEDEETGDLYYIDSDGNEVDCDEFGNPIEEDENNE